MSKFLHDDAGPKCGMAARRLGIEWPALPWRCPTCTLIFPTHAETVATLDVRRYEHPGEATFMCARCDLDLFTRDSNRKGH